MEKIELIMYGGHTDPTCDRHNNDALRQKRTGNNPINAIIITSMVYFMKSKYIM